MNRLWILVVIAMAGAAVTWLYGIDGALPDFDAARAAHRPSEAVLQDRHGAPLHSLRVDATVRRLPWVPLESVSPAAVRVIVQAEDHRFLSHRGIDWLSVAASMRDALTGRGARGASTLTMQVAGMLDPALLRAGRRSGGQKLRQLAGAMLLERRWSKQQILEYYLNSSDFRGELSGIGAAARGLLRKSPAALDTQDGLLLAALLPMPNASFDTVAARACRLGSLAGTKCLAIRARALAVLDAPAASLATAPQLAPHVGHRLLGPGQREMRTTLDIGVQRLVVQALANQLRQLDGRQARDAAALVVANDSGEVLAYVGSGGPASHAPLVDGVRAPRQAGSTLKPFLYALALERRYITAASILDDSAVNLSTPAGLYVPRNYDERFRGPVSARLALASSLNVPAVRVLELTGIAAFHTRLRELGFSTLEDDPEHYGYSLALGSAEVTLWDLVNAYRALARGGLITPLLLQPEPRATVPSRVLDAAAVFIVADILADGAARGPTFGLHSPLATGSWAAVKTGTSKAMRDNWCIGFSDRYTVGVWVGNFEGDAMTDVSGVTGAAPAWSAIMGALHASTPAGDPAPPAGIEMREVSFARDLEPRRKEWFVAGTALTYVAPLRPTKGAVRITAPADGAVLALDPDIPERYQRLAFGASHADAGLRWRLDDEILGDASRLLPWALEPGRHRLELIGSDGHVLDVVGFQVRGTSSADTGL